MRLFTGCRARLTAAALAVVTAGLLASPAGAQVAQQKRFDKRAIGSPSLLPNAVEPTIPAGPYRFFTINQVLAKIDRGGVPQVTSVNAVPGMPGPAAENARNPFGVVSFRAPEGALWVKWRGLEQDLAREAETLRRCRADYDTCSSATLRFLGLVTTARGLSGRARLERVTHAANAAVRYVSDQFQHGVPDRWTTPLATLKSGLGDCEDYAILKYHVLREAGVPEDDLRIVLLRDTATREDHAVLAAQADGRWYILDNRHAGFYEDRALPHYMPLFVLDHEGVKLLARPYAALPQNEGNTFAEMPAARDLGLRGSITDDVATTASTRNTASPEIVMQGAALEMPL